jgi:uncharacterized membrane protein YgaE (UPF0421/DUF939 family)
MTALIRVALAVGALFLLSTLGTVIFLYIGVSISELWNKFPIAHRLKVLRARSKIDRTVDAAIREMTRTAEDQQKRFGKHGY